MKKQTAWISAIAAIALASILMWSAKQPPADASAPKATPEWKEWKESQSARAAEKQKHIEECKSLVRRYIVWRGLNTVGNWEPFGTSDMSLSKSGTEKSPYWVLAGTAHYKLNGNRKLSEFVCDRKQGEPRVTMTSGVLQGVQF